MPSYQRLTDELSLERNQILAIYINCVFSSFLLIILIIIAATLTPLANDAGILIKDAAITLKDFSILIPEINRLIPEARNTTLILGHMVPEIKQGMRILRQLCIQDPLCNL
tara:strand:+ start:1510 stop:1842 length:333 start_codon:yes stop_codon:yes gene_type:complete